MRVIAGFMLLSASIINMGLTKLSPHFHSENDFISWALFLLAAICLLKDMGQPYPDEKKRKVHPY